MRLHPVRNQSKPLTPVEEKAVEVFVEDQYAAQFHAEQKGKNLQLPVAGITGQKQYNKVKS